MSSQKFLVCELCGNLVGLVSGKHAPIMCCGKEMAEIVPNTVEASVEKHLPDVAVAGGKLSVSVGSVPHPMEDGHHIVFVYVETKRGGQRKRLGAGDAPTLEFSIIDDEPVAVYAYCNLHGMWKTEVK
jgi:superoxide reductase